jgi:outer membrane protein TolC
VQTIAAQLVSLVQLYKSLGGGWPAGSEVAASTAGSEGAPPAAPGS